MAPPSKIRLGTASPGTQATTPETLAQLERIARQAADKNIDILLLPEAYIGGYPRGAAFGSVIGGRTNEGRDEYLRYFQSAVDLGDTVGDGAGAGDAWVKRELGGDSVPVTPIAGNGVSNGVGDAPKITTPSRGDGTREQLERIARETGVFLVVGCMEKAGGSLYCAAVYVCPKLGIIGKRRKVMPTGSERLVWAQGSPATLRAVTTTIRGVRINMAAAICWESYMPLLRQALYAQNINLYLAPTADARDSWLSLIRTIGIEGRCFVITSNMCVRDGPPSPATTHESVFSDEKQDTAMADQPDPQPTRRRTSFVTEEGFEIALPPSPTQTHRPSLRPKRRKSVFDEDGNEIVLCCRDEDDDADMASPTSTPPPSTRTWARTAAVARSHVPKPLTALNGNHSKTGTAKNSSENKFLCRGGSSIVSPFGDVLAGPQWEDDSGIIYVDVDFEDCIRGRLDLDAAGSYSRNDSFKFSVQGLDLSPLPY